MVVLIDGPTTLAQIAPDAPAENTASLPTRSLSFDAERLREGRFTYRLTVSGKPQGSFVVSIRRQPDGTYRFTGDAIGFNQHWESVTTAHFEPVSALVVLIRRGQPYRMELVYGNSGVSAIETTGDPAAPVSVTKTTVPLTTGPTIDQRIDWASVMASDLTLNQRARYYVYDALTASSRLFATASAVPAMHSPLGMHEVIRLDYRIEKAGGDEAYSVYATRETPRMMLREDLRDDEVSELEKVEP